MTDIKISQKEPAVAAVEVQKPSYKDLTPAHWNLVESGDGLVTGTNVKSGETFSGSIAEFNELLKG
jgi:hypothetical protein